MVLLLGLEKTAENDALLVVRLIVPPCFCCFGLAVGVTMLRLDLEREPAAVALLLLLRVKSLRLSASMSSEVLDAVMAEAIGVVGWLSGRLLRLLRREDEVSDASEKRIELAAEKRLPPETRRPPPLVVQWR